MSSDAQTVADSSPTVSVIEGGRRGLSRDGIAEFWAHRDVLRAFVIRSIKSRYRQALLGAGWVVVQPVVSALLFALFLGEFAKIGSEGVPYVLFALAGTVSWGLFNRGASAGMGSLVTSRGLLRKIYFPREILPLSNVLASLLDWIPGIAVLLIAAGIFGRGPSPTWVLIPVTALILLLTAAALALFTSAINVYYRDVGQLLPFLFQVLLFGSPIVWSLSEVPAQWRMLYAIGNPVAAAVDTLRQAAIHHTWPDPAIVGGALAWSAVLVIISAHLFKLMERGFADRV